MIKTNEINIFITEIEEQVDIYVSEGINFGSFFTELENIISDKNEEMILKGISFSGQGAKLTFKKEEK